MPKLKIEDRRKVITGLEKALRKNHLTPIWGCYNHYDNERKRVDQSTYLASLFSGELNIDYTVNWTQQIENGVWMSWLSFHNFSRYIPADVVRPISATFFYQNPDKIVKIMEKEFETGDRPNFQIVYGLFVEDEEENAKAFIDDFAENGERFFSMLF